MAVLPPPLMTSEPGSFARLTIEVRKHKIIAAVLQDNDLDSAARLALANLDAELSAAPVGEPPHDIPCYDEWLAEWRLWQGHTWLDLPWYFAEAYFYVRLLHAVGYLQGRCGDPFAAQKRSMLERARVLLPDLVGLEKGLANLPPERAFERLAHRSLWGNRLDLSNQAIAEKHEADPYGAEASAMIVVDECADAYGAIFTATERPVAFLCDNCGPELIADLELALWLLKHGIPSVALELKPQPFFVSDATVQDAQETISFLRYCPVPGAARIGDQLSQAMAEGRLELRDHPFYCGPGFYTDLPADLEQRLGRASLVIAKGDVNYRRFLEDRHWPYTTPLRTAVRRFPTNALLLRTFKGELAAGLSREIVERLEASGPGWLIDGSHAVAQFLAAPSA